MTLSERVLEEAKKEGRKVGGPLVPPGAGRQIGEACGCGEKTGREPSNADTIADSFDGRTSSGDEGVV